MEGWKIGCPAAHGEGNCPMCSGGWPGIAFRSQDLVNAVRDGRLRRDNLVVVGCGTIETQVKHLISVEIWEATALKDTPVGPIDYPLGFWVAGMSILAPNGKSPNRP